ncbi:MAG: helix-turn-helix domain-containing protein, partial [Myxococcota bacterium]
MPRAFTDAERTRIHRLLLEAGRAALATGGLRRVPVERLCLAAGISKGAFYLFFPSKEALVVALLVEAEAELRSEL